MKTSTSKLAAVALCVAAALCLAGVAVSAPTAPTNPGRPIAFVPQGYGFPRVVNGTEALDASLVQTTDIQPGSAGVLSSDGGAVYWGSGGASVPTGTGFEHVTIGAQDSTARAVNLATSDVTGVLPAANQAAQTMGGGTITGTTSSANVTGCVGSGGLCTLYGSLLGFSSALSGPTIYQQATTGTGTANALTISAQQCTGAGCTGGALNVSSGAGVTNQGPINFGIGASTLATMTKAGGITITPLTNNIAMQVTKPNLASTYTAISVDNSGDMYFGASPGAGIANGPPYVVFGGNSATFLQAGSSGNDILTVTSTNICESAPIVGDADCYGGTSPFNVHGYVSVTVVAGTNTLSAAQYANHFLDIVTGSSVSSAISVVFPAGNGAGWTACNRITGTGAVTVQTSGQVTGTFPAVGISAGTCQRIWSDNTNVRKDGAAG